MRTEPLPRPMTWRALFLRLLVASTVMLVAAWALSLFYATRLHLHGAEVTMGHGSVEIRYQEFRDGSTSVIGPLGSRHGRFISQHRAGLPPRDLGLWSWRYGWNHSVVKIVARPSPTAPPTILAQARWYVHTRRFPLWAPWLLFNTCAFAACKLMERRSVAGKEKELAEGEVTNAA